MQQVALVDYDYANNYLQRIGPNIHSARTVATAGWVGQLYFAVKRVKSVA